MSGKFALIIGNTEYTDSGLVQLTAPGRDAKDFGRVLDSPEICAFDDVVVLFNENASKVGETIDYFLSNRKPADLLVLYFSGHGVRDEYGSLYLAVKNTNRSRLRSTAIKSDFIREAMDQSRSKRQILILDCCNSGAFAHGTKAEVGGSVGTASAFEGTGFGRVVLTASDSTQFAWEGDKIIGETSNSLFTHFLIKGLEGDADADGDGRITVDELYDYAYEQIVNITPQQTPGKWSYKQQGEITLRQNLRIEDIKSLPLPAYLTMAIESPDSDIRLGAVQSLTKLLNGRNLGLARSAREALERIALDDDSRRVSLAAKQALESVRQAEQPEVQKKDDERKVREEENAKQIAIEEAEKDRIAQEKANADQKAQEEAQSIALHRANEERIAREKAEADRKHREEAQRIALQRTKEEQIAREKTKQEQLVHEKAKKAPPVTESEVLTKLRTNVSQRTLYSLIIVSLIVAFALIGRYAMQRNAEPESTPMVTATEEQFIPITAPTEKIPLVTTAAPESPSQTPSPIFTSSVETYAFIAASRAYLYKGPALTFSLVVQKAYPRGEKFAILARTPSGLWLLSKAPDGNEGWLYKDWIDLTFDPLIVPTASYIPPTPVIIIEPHKTKDSGPITPEPCYFPPCP